MNQLVKRYLWLVKWHIVELYGHLVVKAIFFILFYFKTAFSKKWKH